ncbi:MAG: 50S ribosomal protein L9, partial [Chloroflexi bacterium]
LLPRKLAQPATKGAQQQVDRAKATTVQREQRELDEAKALAVKLEAVQVVLKLRSGKDGKLFGAVTNADVASALKQQHGITLDRRKIEFDEPVKAMGAGTAHVKLHREVTAQIPLMVTSA